MRDRTALFLQDFRDGESMKLFLNHLFSFYNFDALSDFARALRFLVESALNILEIFFGGNVVNVLCYRIFTCDRFLF